MSVAETQNILKQIYVSSEALVETSEETSGVLDKIYKLQVKRAKADKEADRADDRDAQRKKRDEKRKFADSLKLDKKKKKEDEEGGKKIGNKLKEGLMGLVKEWGPALTGALAGIVPAITGALGGLASGIGGAIMGALKGALTAALAGLKGLLGALGVTAGGAATAVGGVAAAAAAPVAIAAGVGKAMEAERRNRYGGGEAGALAQEMYETELQVNQASKNKRGRRIRPQTEEEKETIKLIEETRKELLEVNEEKKAIKKKREEEIKKVKKNLKTYGSGRSKSKKITPEIEKAIEAINKKYDDLRDQLDSKVSTIVGKYRSAVKLQKGGELPGAFTVPGSGDGDQYPIDLPAGSFVLNRTASRALEGRQALQSGGATNMISTLLEPGERVFLPGQWDDNISTLNSMVPRFGPSRLQDGGKVDSPKAQSDSGSARGGSVPKLGGIDTEAFNTTLTGRRVLPAKQRSSGFDLESILGPIDTEAFNTTLTGRRVSEMPKRTQNFNETRRQADLDFNTILGLGVGGKSAETEQVTEQEGEKQQATGGTGAKAVVAAAEKGAKMALGKGVNMQCANTTRQVLRMAGHPAAGKTTKKGDLDPEGLKYSAPQFAASFAGTDMGTIKKSVGSLAPGDVVLWKNTFSSMAGPAPGAITHVGIKGEGGDVYDHGKGPGWRKRPMWDGGKFAFGVTLGGTGSAGGGEQLGVPAADGTGPSIVPDGEGDGGSGDGIFGGMGFMGMLIQALKEVAGISSPSERPPSAALSQGTQVAGGTPKALNMNASAAGGAYGEESLIAALDAAGMTNKNERAMFISQMAHESGNFKYTEEIHDGSNYEGRQDLGNTQPGDGKRFKGRGYIQLTGRANYRQYGKLVGADLENNPELAADPAIAAKVALAYWNKRVDRKAAQAGDVRTVTKNINGGYNGLADRQDKWKQYSAKKLQVGGVVNMKGAANKVDTRMQEANESYNHAMAEGGSSAPIVITAPGGGSSGPDPSMIANNPSVKRQAPDLPDDCAASFAADYTYNVNLGGY